VVVALQGVDGKPRPALVIRSDLFAEHPSVTVVPVTSRLRRRAAVQDRRRPGRAKRSGQASQLMVDKAQTVPREKVGGAIARLDDRAMEALPSPFLRGGAGGGAGDHGNLHMTLIY
jgi:mRNA interferase MazF